MVISVLSSQRDDFELEVFVVLFAAVYHLSSLSVFGELPTMCLGGDEHCLQKVKKTVTHFF